MPLDPDIPFRAIAGLTKSQPYDPVAVQTDIDRQRVHQAAAQKAQQEMAEQADLQQLAQQYGNDFDGLIDAAAKRGHTEWALDITKKLQDGRAAGAQQRWEQTRASRAEIQSDLAEVQGADENTWPETSQRLAKKYPTLAPAFLRPFSPQLQQQLVSIGQSQDQWLQSIETGAKSVADGKTLKGFAEAYAGADTPEKRAVVDKMAEDSKAAGMKTYLPDVASAQGWLEKNAKADPEKAAKVGTFEDYMVEKYGPRPTPDQIIEGRKKYGQADDRPLRSSVTVQQQGPVVTDPAVMARIAGMTPEALDTAARRLLDDGSMPTRLSEVAKKQIMNRAGQLNPQANLALNVAEYKADSKALGQLTTQLNAVEAFEKTGLKNLKLFTDAAAKIPDTGIPWLNTPVRALSSHLVGSENMAAVNAARQVALTEISRVVSNPNLTGVLSDSAREEILSLSPTNATFAQIKRVAQVLEQDMANRKQSMREQVAQIKGGVGGHGTQQAAPAEKVPAGSIKIGRFTVRPK